MRLFVLGVTSLIAVAVSAGCSSPSAATSDEALTELPACLPTLACAAPPPPATETHAWRHWIETPTLVTHDPTSGLPSAPIHRGRDLFVNPGQTQTIIAHFTYGITNTELEDEDVDIFVQRDCASGWEPLGTATTTTGGEPHAEVEGITDSGGHIYFDIPKAKELGLGRHRVRLVVRGDNSSTDLFLDVVPPSTPIFVSDVDGTLTSSENIEYAALLVGAIPDTHEGAPEAFQKLVAKGYRPMYLTARPEWLVQRTRDFLDAHGFPPGVIHTTASYIGATPYGGAAQFKTGDLAQVKTHGLTPAFGFGNKPTDSEAYATAITDPQRRFFYQIDGAFEGRRIESYTELHSQFDAVAPVCKK